MSSAFYRLYARVRESVTALARRQLYYDSCVLYLQEKNINCIESGITAEDISDAEVIVTLTTHGRRIYEAFLAIESIMQGTIKPNRIILWLSNDIKCEKLPQTLLNQCKRGLEVRYTKDIGPYTKLVPSLRAYPHALLVTIDDDVIYPYDTLELLLNAHALHPSFICGNRCLDVKIKKDGTLASFPTWKELEEKGRICKRNFFEGLAGVLYPPGCFPEEVFDEAVFQSICPTADDIWFNCMALKKETDIMLANNHYVRFPLVFNDSVQDMGLWCINNNPKDCQHDKQLIAVMQHFKLSYAE